MEGKTISDYTESEFLELVRKIFNVENTSEEEDIQNLLEFERLCEHPDGSDLTYYPNDDREDSPEGILAEIKNGEPKMVSRGLRNKSYRE